MATCKDCIHYEPCYEYGNILDPLGGGVKCDSFKDKADFVEVKHGEYIYSSTDDKWHCSECFAERPRNNGDIPYSDIYCCYKCGAKMMGGNDAKGSN